MCIICADKTMLLYGFECLENITSKILPFCERATLGRSGEMGVLLPEGNGQNQLWQKDLDKGHLSMVLLL